MTACLIIVTLNQILDRIYSISFCFYCFFFTFIIFYLCLYFYSTSQHLLFTDYRDKKVNSVIFQFFIQKVFIHCHITNINNHMCKTFSSLCWILCIYVFFSNNQLLYLDNAVLKIMLLIFHFIIIKYDYFDEHDDTKSLLRKSKSI